MPIFAKICQFLPKIHCRTSGIDKNSFCTQLHPGEALHNHVCLNIFIAPSGSYSGLLALAHLTTLVGVTAGMHSLWPRTPDMSAYVHVYLDPADLNIAMAWLASQLGAPGQKSSLRNCQKFILGLSKLVTFDNNSQKLPKNTRFCQKLAIIV